MDSGGPGAPGVPVLRPVEKVRRPGLEDVTLQLQLVEERPALVIGVSLKDVTRILAPIQKVQNRIIQQKSTK